MFYLIMNFYYNQTYTYLFISIILYNYLLIYLDILHNSTCIYLSFYSYCY